MALPNTNPNSPPKFTEILKEYPAYAMKSFGYGIASKLLGPTLSKGLGVDNKHYTLQKNYSNFLTGVDTESDPENNIASGSRGMGGGTVETLLARNNKILRSAVLTLIDIKKILKSGARGSGGGTIKAETVSNPNFNSAAEALTGLGYKKKDSEVAIQTAIDELGPQATESELIKKALSNRGKNLTSNDVIVNKSQEVVKPEVEKINTPPVETPMDEEEPENDDHLKDLFDTEALEHLLKINTVSIKEAVAILYNIETLLGGKRKFKPNRRNIDISGGPILVNDESTDDIKNAEVNDTERNADFEEGQATDNGPPLGNTLASIFGGGGKGIGGALMKGLRGLGAIAGMIGKAIGPTVTEKMGSEAEGSMFDQANASSDIDGFSSEALNQLKGAFKAALDESGATTGGSMGGGIGNGLLTGLEVAGGGAAGGGLLGWLKKSFGIGKKAISGAAEAVNDNIAPAAEENGGFLSKLIPNASKFLGKLGPIGDIGGDILGPILLALQAKGAIDTANQEQNDFNIAIKDPSKASDSQLQNAIKFLQNALPEAEAIIATPTPGMDQDPNLLKQFGDMQRNLKILQGEQQRRKSGIGKTITQPVTTNNVSTTRDTLSAQTVKLANSGDMSKLLDSSAPFGNPNAQPVLVNNPVNNNQQNITNNQTNIANNMAKRPGSLSLRAYA